MAHSPALGSRGLAPLLAVVLLAATLARARGDDPRVLPAFVEIATIEHRRTGVAGLDPYLAPEADPATRREAIVALGRIGTDDDEVVPRLRAFLARGGTDLELTLWAAGISGQKALLCPVLAILDSSTGTVQIAAIEAVGMLGDARADGFLIPLLGDDDAKVRTEAGYALSRAGSDRALEAVVAHAGEKDPEARRAIAAAIWRCAGVRKRARTTKEHPWNGDPAAAEATTPLASDPDPETRLFALRALNSLWPKAVAWEQVRGAASDPDPRVAADFLFRLAAAGHAGLAVVEAGRVGLSNPDALVRETAAETLGKVGGDEAARALRERASSEPDARVRERIAIALSQCGDGDTVAKLLAREDRPKDPAARAATQAKVLLASKKPESVPKAVAMLRDKATPVLALEALLEGFGDVDPTPEIEAALREVLAHPDRVVRGSAATLIGDKKLTGLAPDIAKAAASPRPVGDVDTERDARQGVLEASLALDDAGFTAIQDEKERKARALALSAQWDAALRKEPSASVRRSMLEKLSSTALGRKGMPTLTPSHFADLPKNDWRGLPRPKAPILDLDFSGGTGWLSEEEILKLAARISERGVLLAVETEGLGVTTYRLDPDEAPVHAASTVIAATSGVYDGTSWHRVVPAFVIQGADPRGDGSGDAGWLLPDEITHRPFLRGALGMPKGVKDTGGCQLFAMHCYAPHLDGRYTAFGEVVSGQEVVDRIRVGDRIRSVRLVEPPRGK